MASWPARGRGVFGKTGAAPRLLGLGLVLAVAGCGGAPPPPPPTIVELKLSAAADSNPTLSGQGAPLAVRVYQLGSTAGFERSEFYPLYRQDAATLGADLVKKDEYLLTPGTGKTATLTLADPVRAIGVFAAYRDFQNAAWRATVPIPPHATTTLTVTTNATGVTAAAAPAPAAR